MTPIKSIVFDGSGVITDERPKETTKKWSERYNIPFDKIWEIVYLKNYYLARDGKLGAQQYYRQSINELRMTIRYKEFVKDYIADRAVRSEMLKILKELYKKISLYLLSNQTEINTIYLRPIIAKYFKMAFFSNEIKMHKPDPEIYEYFFKKTKIYPTTSLFIDDKDAPLTQAKKFNMNVYKFISVEDLKSKLVSLKLLG